MNGDGLISGVTAEEVRAAERAEKYRVQLERPEVFPSPENWDYIMEFGMDTLAGVLMRKFVMSWLTPVDNRSDYHDLCLERFPRYLQAIRRECAVDAVYADIYTAPEAVKFLVHESQLFDAQALLNLLDDPENAPFVCACIDAYQPVYETMDIPAMQRLHEALLQLPALGCVEEQRTFLSRELRYICPNGHANPSDCEFCHTCGLDINGLTEAQATNISRLETRIRLLPGLLAKNKKALRPLQN